MTWEFLTVNLLKESELWFGDNGESGKYFEE